MRRLQAGADEVDADTFVAQLRLGERAPDDRPYTVVNFISSVDGRATFNGRSGALGDEGDLELFRALRSEADAVLAGTGTLAAERYGRLIKNPERRAARQRRGLAPEPMAVVISRSGELPTGIPLFAEPEANIVVFAGGDPASALEDVAASVEVVTVADDADPIPLAMRSLRRDHGVRLLLCEGGPRLFAALVAAGAADELFLTLAPKLALGGGPSITAGLSVDEPVAMRLAGVLERAGSLFLRYSIEI